MDAIVGNSKNVIDLEMALPAWGDQESALRMDLVSLEQAGNKIQIAFWEAKTFDDGRLRSKAGKPEVIGQLLGGDDPGAISTTSSMGMMRPGSRTLTRRHVPF